MRADIVLHHNLICKILLMCDSGLLSAHEGLTSVSVFRLNN